MRLFVEHETYHRRLTTTYTDVVISFFHSIASVWYGLPSPCFTDLMQFLLKIIFPELV